MVPMEEVNALSLRCFKPPGYNYKAGLLSNPPNLLCFQPREYFVFCACFLRQMDYQIFMENDFSALFV